MSGALFIKIFPGELVLKSTALYWMLRLQTKVKVPAGALTKPA